ncbi:hypothetical protein ZIOFF_014725 [Zingiber officinale]|uniref:Disease resistance R13L4/SHOC-2-like LRR domain-containing protein n=1 Tax=Zingiber officinale TaxID=94328 RepID=A0A8J5HBA3_ZINOF|nr:hypothetical protein ZIOFF_014725 [Zingiber officinale]
MSLCMLDMKAIMIQDLPRAVVPLRCLRYLNLTENKIETLPESICNLYNLCVLNLSSCEKLKELPIRIHKLRKLKILKLSYCLRIQKLPESIICLVNLNELDIGGCCRLSELPDDLSGMKNLMQLNMAGCAALTRMPRGIKQWINMQSLSGIDAVDGHGNIMLIKIYMSWCRIGNDGMIWLLRELPIPRCSCWKDSYVAYEMPKAHGIPCAISNIFSIEVEIVVEQRDANAYFQIQFLTLTIMNCNKLEALPIWLEQSCLESLSVHDCRVLSFIPEELKVKSSLKNLVVEAFPKLQIQACDPLTLGKLGGKFVRVHLAMGKKKKDFKYSPLNKIHAKISFEESRFANMEVVVANLTADIIGCDMEKGDDVALDVGVTSPVVGVADAKIDDIAAHGSYVANTVECQIDEDHAAGVATLPHGTSDFPPLRQTQGMPSSPSPDVVEETSSEQQSLVANNQSRECNKTTGNGEDKQSQQKKSSSNLFKDNRKTKLAILSFDYDDIDSVEDAMRFCLVGCFMSRHLGIDGVRTIGARWKIKRIYFLHKNGWVVYCFDTEEDREKVLKGGPYFVFERVYEVPITLPTKFKIDLRIIYESLPKFCEVCKRLGHRSDTCRRNDGPAGQHVNWLGANVLHGANGQRQWRQRSQTVREKGRIGMRQQWRPTQQKQNMTVAVEAQSVEVQGVVDQVGLQDDVAHNVVQRGENVGDQNVHDIVVQNIEEVGVKVVDQDIVHF